VARPMPVVPPVTSAYFPENSAVFLAVMRFLYF
jgi:hypothetical protein